MDSSLYFLATTIAVLFIAGHAEDCGPAAIGACTGKMKQVQDPTILCNSMNEAKTCISDLKKKCPDFDVAQFEPLTNNPMCSDACMELMKCGMSMQSQTSPPTEEDIKNDKDGKICKTIAGFKKCYETHLEGCKAPKLQEQFGVMNSKAETLAGFCDTKASNEEKGMAGKDEAKAGEDMDDKDAKDDDDAKDSATSAQFSPLLLLVLPVFLQAWFLM